MKKRKQETIHCEDLKKMVTITMDMVMMDEDTFIPNRLTCALQDDCNIYKKADGLCPAMDKLHKKYTSQLG